MDKKNKYNYKQNKTLSSNPYFEESMNILHHISSSFDPFEKSKESKDFDQSVKTLESG